MKRNVFITGGTGALGPFLLADWLSQTDSGILYVLIRDGQDPLENRFSSLLEQLHYLRDHLDYNIGTPRDRIQPVAGDVTETKCDIAQARVDELKNNVRLVIHGAANTRFDASRVEARSVNVKGTENVLELARECADLERFVHLSTTCVAGKQTGRIPETVPECPDEFVNEYERTKWEAEQRVSRFDLPTRILRLVTVMGSGQNGYVTRKGALHSSLYWFSKGLIPMVPGDGQTTINFLSSEDTARAITVASITDGPDLDVVNVAAQETLSLPDFIDFLTDEINRTINHDIERPPLVGEETYRKLARDLRKSKNSVFSSVLDGVDSFLPSLLYPKTPETDHLYQLFDEEFPTYELKNTLRNVLHHSISSFSESSHEPTSTVR